MDESMTTPTPATDKVHTTARDGGISLFNFSPSKYTIALIFTVQNPVDNPHESGISEIAAGTQKIT